MNSGLYDVLVSKLDFSFGRSVPQIIQTESAECGLACLAMVCGYHGYRTDLLSLRQTYAVSLHGLKLSQLMDIAHALNMHTRALSLGLEDLKNLRLPCILHWGLDHFVVLTKVGRKNVTIHDPALGKKVVDFEELSNQFTGVALELWPTTTFRKEKKRKSLKILLLLNNIDGLKVFLFKLLLFTLIVEAINILIPIGTQLVMDHVILAEDRSLLALICIGLFASIFLKTFVSALRSWITITNDSLINAQWSSSLFDHLVRLPLSFFEKRKLGDIQSRFASLETVRQTFTSGIVNSVIDGIMVIAVLVMMFLYGNWLVWVVVFFTLIYCTMRLLTYAYYRQLSEDLIIKEAKESSYFMESLYGISTLKALNLSKTRARYWFNLKVDSINSSIRITKFDMIFSGASSFIAAIDEVVILWLGASMVIDGNMTLGMFVAFNAYRGQFSERASNLINVIIDLRMLTLHSERIADIALSEPEQQRPNLILLKEGATADIEINNLSFQYDPISNPIFTDLNFKISTGEIVAITGPSGVGKTTLIKILCGLLKPSTGKVLLNKLDINQIGVNNYRNHIACVLQDDKLFSGSILENIAGFDLSIDSEYVIECAKLCHIHDEISRMPMGYRTLVSELGGSLSGGQRQRLLIARALYRKPHIMFMDEATSHLDVDNESKINAAISSLNITRVIVAHRPSTIASADRVIYMPMTDSM